jgi:hypothetical protein
VHANANEPADPTAAPRPATDADRLMRRLSRLCDEYHAAVQARDLAEAERLRHLAKMAAFAWLERLALRDGADPVEFVKRLLAIGPAYLAHRARLARPVGRRR